MRIVRELRRGVADLNRDGHAHVLVAIAAGWFLSLGVRLVYPVLIPHLRVDYGLGLSAAGTLLTALWLAYAIGQLPGGVLADRIGEGNVLVVSSVVAAATLTLVFVSRSVLVLFAATALFGFGTALYGVARFTALSQLYPNSDGTAIGVTMAAGEAGNAILPLVAGVVASVTAWQYGFGVFVPCFVLVAVGLWVAVPARTSGTASAVETLSLETVRYVLDAVTQPAVVLVFLIQLLLYSVWQAFTGFYPTYLVEVKGLSTPIATGLFSLFFAFGVVVQPLAGGAYDRLGARRSLPAFILLFSLALAAVPFLEGVWPLTLVTILLSSLLGFAVITLSHLTAALPSDVQGTALGLLRTVYMSIGAASPVVAGVLAERGFFDETFLLMALLGSVSILLCTRIPR